MHWSCADVLRVPNLNLRRKAAKFAALCVEMVKILQQIPASLMQILAKFCACSTAGCAHFRHCTHQKIDAAILKRHHVFAATLAELLVRCASTAQRICNEFAHFLAEKLRNRGAERTIFSARNTAPTCIGAADISKFSNRNNLRRNCKIWFAARRNGENFAANSCVIDANFGKVLRMSDRWMRAFSASHAPATRRRNPAASECFCSDAGRSFAALRVGRAENLQRIRAFSGGKNTHWRRQTHGFFGAQHSAEFYRSHRRLLIFEAELF